LISVIALVGRPNTGKTTLFNALTGSRQRVANFAGCTVEKAVGIIDLDGREVEVVDLPGTFSILAGSQDERVAFDFLAQTPPNDLKVICVAEASNLAGDLSLALSLKACGYPVSLVVNMIDEAAINGLSIDGPRLASETGLPVALASARHGQGLDRIRSLMELQEESTTPPLALGRTPRRALRDIHERERLRAAAISSLTVSASHRGLLATTARTIAIDRTLFHPLLGPLVLGALLFLVFQSLFTWAQPVMDLIEGAFAALSRLARPAIASPLLASLVCDGIIAGVSAVAVFVPQIAILFCLIGFLEASGYLPRAGAMVQRALRPFGLDGKVVIPFLSSFACAIPGVMATRTIPDEKRRLKAILLAPLMTCSARIPVYTLIIGAFVPLSFRPLGLNGQALVMAGMYAFGVAAALLAALAMKGSVLSETTSLPVTVLPPYRFPMPRELARYVWARVRHFIDRAGRVIFVLSLALWFLGSFPRQEPGADAARQMEGSFLGMAGHAIEPAFRPLGYDWKLTVGVISSLAAREVFVGTMGTLLALSGETEGSQGLSQALRRRYGLPTAVSLLIFFALAMQCLSTIAVVRRETGGWRWPAIQLGGFFVLAYALSWLGYTLTSALMR
jgi:ferrous iron transport protein B